MSLLIRLRAGFLIWGFLGSRSIPAPGVLITVLDALGDQVLEAVPAHLSQAAWCQGSMGHVTAKPPDVISNCDS